MLSCMINTVALSSDTRERYNVTQHRARLVLLRRESASETLCRGRSGHLQVPERIPGPW